MSRCDDATTLGAEIMTHWPTMLRTARSLVADTATAEDLAAEAVARTLRRCLNEGPPIRHLRAYLCTVVRAIGIDHHRREQHITWVAELSDATHPRAVAADTSLLDRVVRDEEYANLARAFHGLLPGWQDVLHRVHVEGHRPKEVATDLGLTPTSVSARAWRARRALREGYLSG
ncbi:MULTISPECIES: RNA polymerase sigma factor [Actinoalloteichus]|uniref:RNA polymerase sigma factor, sigma-70 family n=1 Tax=Actinoalloteichus fjordicus TaxID=1612552 RepID=A0AAC9PTE6_9PSEU|nr:MULTISPECIES: sigma-70 family RNA polymerase sigma factor [Actinoalloteichus]APU15980.1 RNA polymerase sigma factor, sigma-70 family [Actinoalloteichus fjordicus]APU22044.1 RNA polymerase sigma factor, sigma-70 family [Actinoalloteichus sp. GBA129-24]